MDVDGVVEPQKNMDVDPPQIFQATAPDVPRSPPPLEQPTDSVTVPKPNYKSRYLLSGHTMSISSLKFSPDGSKLASSGVLACMLSSMHWPLRMG